MDKDRIKLTDEELKGIAGGCLIPEDRYDNPHHAFKMICEECGDFLVNGRCFTCDSKIPKCR